MNCRFATGGLLLLLAATLFTQSCEGKPKPADDPVQKSLSVSPSAIDVTYEATTEVLTVTANCDWGVSAADKAEVRRIYDRCKREAESESARRANEAHEDWYRNNGFNIQIRR